MIPFRTQYDKIVGAYLRNELDPTCCTACFVGNLLNNTYLWSCGRDLITGRLEEDDFFPLFVVSCRSVKYESEGTYTAQEVWNLEQIFLKEIGHLRDGRYIPDKDSIPNYEERLFKAMEVTLEALRKLHESKGEVVEDYVFNKRELQEV